jgi:hypothetical protein
VTRPGWDFDCVPVRVPREPGKPSGCDWVVATPGAVDSASLLVALHGACPAVRIEQLVERAPIFWTRIRCARAVTHADLTSCLARAAIVFRYVASATTPDLSVAPPLEIGDAAAAHARGWRVRGQAQRTDPATPSRWFLGGDGGVNVDRKRFSGGAGTRLAVIDNDAGEADLLDLDAEVLINVPSASRVSLHGAILIGWAVGSRVKVQGEGADVAFRGVAPDASPRLYCIPKPGDDVLSLPMAIVRAANDGADVIVCATYVDGTTSPLLDDALEFASRLGRRGRGAVVILPACREASSPASSVHASLSISLADPASDPRVMCIAPSGRDGSWFLWRDRKGKFRPFANRGPAVRWLAPGDDLAFPFGGGERFFHAESSGASAIAAGVVLLVMASNPLLRVDELDDVLQNSAEPASPSGVPTARLADSSDVMPRQHDRDGHNAKHGYGRLNATRACLLASDPITASLTSIGEESAALAYLDLRRSDPTVAALYSTLFGRWAVRVLLADARAMHAAKVILRHARLVAGDVERLHAHGDGAVLRQVALLLRGLLDNRRALATPRSVSLELARLVERLSDLSASPEGRAAWDKTAYELFTDVAHRAAQVDARPETDDPLAASAPLGSQLVRA